MVLCHMSDDISFISKTNLMTFKKAFLKDTRFGLYSCFGLGLHLGQMTRLIYYYVTANKGVDKRLLELKLA